MVMIHDKVHGVMGGTAYCQRLVEVELKSATVSRPMPGPP